MNNKGQTLVIFVLILPIIVLGIIYVFLELDSSYEKKKQIDIANIICNYSKKENDINELIKLGNENDKSQEINIKRINDSIEITLMKESILKMKIKTVTIC